MNSCPSTFHVTAQNSISPFHVVGLPYRFQPSTVSTKGIPRLATESLSLRPPPRLLPRTLEKRQPAPVKPAELLPLHIFAPSAFCASERGQAASYAALYYLHATLTSSSDRVPRYPVDFDHRHSSFYEVRITFLQARSFCVNKYRLNKSELLLIIRQTASSVDRIPCLLPADTQSFLAIPPIEFNRPPLKFIPSSCACIDNPSSM